MGRFHVDFTQSLIDMLRAAHLVCFAAGLGTALYFDFRTLRTFGDFINLDEIENLMRLHTWIHGAVTGLWVTGVALIYVRTAFDLSAFTPKLWLKLVIMTGMAVNSGLIGYFVLPTLRDNLGRTMATLPGAKLVIAAQIGIMSMFCWTSGLVLGSSVELKTAPWEVLLPLVTGGFLAFTVFGQISVALLRRRTLAIITPDGMQA